MIGDVKDRDCIIVDDLMGTVEQVAEPVSRRPSFMAARGAVGRCAAKQSNPHTLTSPRMDMPSPHAAIRV